MWDDEDGMEDGGKKEYPPTRMRMTCLLWLAILVFTALFARTCAFLISQLGVRG